MAITPVMVTVDSAQPAALARWWAARLGGEILAENDDFVMISAGEESAWVLGFQHVPEPTAGKNRLHVDLATEDLESEVERLLDAGAHFVDRHDVPGHGWIVLSDPDGNYFCVTESVLDDSDLPQ